MDGEIVEVEVLVGSEQIGAGADMAIGEGAQITEAGGDVAVGVGGHISAEGGLVAGDVGAQISAGGGVQAVGVVGQLGDAVGVNSAVKGKGKGKGKGKRKQQGVLYCWFCGKDLSKLLKQPSKPGFVQPSMRHLIDCEDKFNLSKTATYYLGLKGEKF